MIIHSLIDISIAHHTKGKVETRRHHPICTLAEHITNIGQESRQMHGILRTEADVHRTNHHQHTGHTLSRLIPPFLFFRRLGCDAELQLHSVAIADKYLVLVNHLILHVIGFAILRTGTDDDTLRAFVMGHCHSGIHLQSDLTLVGILVKRQNLLIGGGSLFLIPRIP